MSRIDEALRRIRGGDTVPAVLMDSPREAIATWAFPAAVTDAAVRPPANGDRLVGGVAPPPASEDAIRLALQMRNIQAKPGGRLLMFVPASRDVDASVVVADAVCGLLELHEGPVLVVDLRPTPFTSTPTWLRGLSDDEERAGTSWGAGINRSPLIVRPFANRREKAPHAASPEFGARLAEARSRYAYVLCIGDEVSASVETLMMAPLVDGVVLAVAPDRVTRPHMRRLTDQLRRAQAHLIGFVVDARAPRKGA